jgi:hypothetical protein
MGFLIVAVIVGFGRLAFGVHDDGVPITINVLWAIYDMVALSVVLDATFYRPSDDGDSLAADSAATIHGRAGTGGK